MKKTFSCALLTFMLSFLFMFASNKVSALGEVWAETGKYSLVEESKDSKYHFDKQSENYNYSFDYEYALDTTNYIYDNGSAISYFYGVSKNTVIEHIDLVSSNIFDPIDDRIVVYKYNFTSKDFLTVVYNPALNNSGSYTLSEPGIYKVITDGVDGTQRASYIIYEKGFYSINIDSATFVNGVVPTLGVKSTIRSPHNVTSCGEYTIKINEVSFNLSSCEINKKEESVDEYELSIDVYLGNSLTYVKEGNIEIDVSGNVAQGNEIVNFDVADPIISNVKYYNENLVKSEFSLSYNQGIVLPNDVIYVAMVIQEDSLLTDAALDFGIETYSEVCANSGNISSCTYSSVDEIIANVVYSVKTTKSEENFYLVEYTFYSDNYDIINSITYEIVDEYGNTKTLNHYNISFDEILLPEGEELVDHVDYRNDQFYLTFVDIDNVNKICIFYGDDLNNEYECKDIIASEFDFVPSYAYRGNVSVILLDTSMNLGQLQFVDVNFSNGYAPSEFTSEVEGNNVLEVDLETKLTELITIACGNDESCKDDIANSTYVKYGNVVEELSDTKLPTYLVMMNTKFKDSSCAIKACNNVVEVYIEYSVGGVKQTLSMYYNYLDNLPYVFTSSAVAPDENTFIFNTQTDLEYGMFDITLEQTKKLLYGNGLQVTLKDVNGTSYIGIIEPVFVSYKDSNGNVTPIDNENYTYISEVSDLGYYTLECKVRILNDITNEISYENESVYTKSSFMIVSLQDTIKPTLTLSGDESVKVQQNDVYKDDGAKCDDLSGCVINTTYYLNEENNEVSGIDTSVAGKYIIKYVAVDKAGNISSSVTRIVNVEAINVLNSTSIIIIVCVVLVFVLVVTLGIILEIIKNKKLKDME